MRENANMNITLELSWQKLSNYSDFNELK